MNKISTKLAVCFFIAVLIMESLLMYYLHQNMISNRVEEEFSLLLANGANHRDVLIENYSDTTIKHIVLMEKNEKREVMIIDSTGSIIGSSDNSYMLQEEYQLSVDDFNGEKDNIVVSDWRSLPYIVSVHPYIVDQNRSGVVLMFQSTKSINQMVDDMNLHFVIAGIIGLIVLFIIYALLSKILTRPLIRMKEATEKLSKGDFEVNLPNLGSDELGDLSNSIHKLAKDLKRLKNERNEFLASIAHELNTPLTYLIGYSKVAKRENLSDKDQKYYLEIIGEESNRMKELMKNLLDLARMDENSFTISKEHFLAKPFLENIYKFVAPSFEIKKSNLILFVKAIYTFMLTLLD